MELAGKKVVITGGAGFIGHNLALGLKRLGAHVDVVDSLQVNNLNAFSRNANNLPQRELYLSLIHERLDLLRAAQIPLHILDLRDYHMTVRLLDELRPDVIVHLSAVAHANMANKDPYSTFDHSLRTLENVLDYARDSKPHLIFFSSSMVYGNFTNGMVSEESPCEPLGIYGALKFAGEKMVIAYNQVFDLPFTIVRPSALYGERCVSRRVGQVFIENALSGLSVTMDGDGSDRLDFTYIDDVVHGVSRIIQSNQAVNQIFNLTFGQGRSIHEMVDILRSHFPEIDVRHKDRDRLMPHRGTLDVSKAQRLIGYEPSFPLEKGFVRYIEWYKRIWKNDSTEEHGSRTSGLVGSA